MPDDETAKRTMELVEMISHALSVADQADMPLVAIHLDEALAALKRIKAC
ncbi:hypothetical protein H5J25_04455 [Sphingomonas aliaeris]|uniref:Uncharacterized protein n=1 Tax=Sphingomonas aliaeris TaxID=2759526 RepID=A0A974NVW8_9SPHN|nr:hypothetical protein [Sphingomonas aliaeris]QQV77999.1 hypothetical protein H5J25_04455 [Sphingomonas aliaeris]